LFLRCRYGRALERHTAIDDNHVAQTGIFSAENDIVVKLRRRVMKSQMGDLSEFNLSRPHAWQ
jgi:hypothetical protein